MSRSNAIGGRLSDSEAFRQPGLVAGVPLIESNAAADHLVAVDTQRILLADDGLRVSVSRQASIEMLDAAATNSSGVSSSPPTAVPTSLVSLYQTNSVGILAERVISWQALSGAVAVLSGANYLSAIGSPS